MLKLLFVDDTLNDDSSSASIAVRNLEAIDEFSIVQADFSDAEKKIDDLVPDLIILDLQEVTASGDRSFTGNSTIEWIWENRFCPVIVYSAFPDQLSDKHRSHPFIEVVTKGKKGPENLNKKMTSLRPHIESIREAERNIRKAFSEALRDVAPYAYDTFKADPAQRNDTILRSGRRRLAALMDGLSMDGTKLASWELYLCPPVCPDTELGDVLRKADGENDDPTSFRVVLTPSCDLVASGDRVPKVENVLVARCCSMKDGLDLTSLKDMKPPKLKTRLPGVLRYGYFEGLVPFPCLEGRIPTMAAKLRDLEFIPVGDIGIEENAFLRVASVDSPLRELIAWAYLQIACRPGLPDRDTDSWCDEIVTLLDGEGDSERT